ncbi:MAG: ester cyclase [Bacteroidia bacterium]|nr:ester cyclase [Bacteroidia bacterium]
MKKLLLLGFAVLLFAACQQEQRYTQQSPEIDTVKKLIKNYNDKTYDASIYADTSKTYYNTKGKGMSPKETIEYHKANDAMYSSRSFLDEDQEYEMVKTDDGQTWVNCWLDWKGTLAVNGKEFMVPIHLTYQFADSKIVREVGMWDPSEIVLEAQAMSKMTVEEKAMLKANSDFIKAWSDNDFELLKSITTKNIVRVANGETAAKNQDEIGDIMKFWHTTIPDFNLDLKNSVVNGNKTYTSWTSTGTNTGNFGENPPTGKKSITQGFTILTFNNEGKIIHEEAFYDLLSVLNQWGYTVTPPAQ